MRTFILLALKVPTTEKLIDVSRTEVGVVYRTLLNAFHYSKGIRNDTIVHIICNGPKDPPRLITFDGSKLEKLPLMEEELVALLKEVIKKGENLISGDEKEVFRGISIAKKSFEALIKSCESPLYYLHKKGDDIRKSNIKENMTFILGDLFGIPKKTEKFIARYNTTPLSIGPTMLLASQCVVVAHNELDRRRREG